MGDAGFLGMTADEDVGGLAMGYQAHCIVMEEISRAVSVPTGKSDKLVGGWGLKTGKCPLHGSLFIVSHGTRYRKYEV